MDKINNIKLKEYNLIQLNNLIHKDSNKSEYHAAHVKLVCKYAILISKRLLLDVNNYKLRYSALSHDLLKDRKTGIKDREVIKDGITFPNDLNWYVRTNLDILELYGLDDYFNTDVQLHALAAGIYLHKELGVNDPEILYPIFFHSCPIMPVYNVLDSHTQSLVDIIMLADKLSSNHIRVMNGKVKYNLKHMVFGRDGNEFNYSLGLVLSRVISQGNRPGEHAILATNHYLDRLIQQQPFISEKILEDMKIWLKR